MKKTLLTKLLATYGAFGVNAVSSIVLVPVYIKIIGIDHWHLVAYCITIQGFLAVLDLGASQIIPKDVATNVGLGRLPEIVSFYRKWYFWFATTTVGVAVSVIYLRKDALGLESVCCLLAAVVQFFFQFQNNVSLGWWNGRQRQERASVSLISFTILKHGLAITSLLFLYAHPFVYIAAFSLSSCCEFYFNKMMINTELVREHKSLIIESCSWSPFHLISTLLRMAPAMLLGVAVGQADRFLAVRLLAPDDFAHYSIAVGLGFSLLQIQYPAVRVFSPRIFSESKGSSGVFMPSSRYLILAQLLIGLSPILLVYLVGPELLNLWLDNRSLANAVYNIINPILFGNLMNCVYNVTYQHVISFDYAAVVFWSNIAALTSVLLFYPFLKQNADASVAAYVWPLAAGVQMLMGTLLYITLRLKNA